VILDDSQAPRKSRPLDTVRESANPGCSHDIAVLRSSEKCADEGCGGTRSSSFAFRDFLEVAAGWKHSNVVAQCSETRARPL